MPTGYTADLYEGKEVTVSDFIMGCARAFGALVLMRDDPKDAPIPDQFEPDPHYAAAANKERQRLRELEQMSDEECAAANEAEFTASLERWKKRRQEAQARRERYNRMLAEVEGWTPPTADHVGLKEFMIQQLESSIQFDCSESFDPVPVRIDPEAWRSKSIAATASALERQMRNDDEERQRAAERSQWVKALRESLPVRA